MEYTSPKRLNANLLRVKGYKAINAYCDRTGKSYFETVQNCFDNRNPHEQSKQLHQSRFKFYLNFAINASKLVV